MAISGTFYLHPRHWEFYFALFYPGQPPLVIRWGTRSGLRVTAGAK